MKSINFNKRVDGYLTVFLALSMTIILSLCLVLVEGARQNGARLMSECVIDAGLNSIFAEYHRELLEQYDLLYIDASYGSEQSQIYNTVERLRMYMERNFSLKDLSLGGWAKDLFSLSVQNLKIESTSLATDRQGKGYRKQAIQAMYYEKTLGLYDEIQKWMSVVEENDLSGEAQTAKRESVESAISSINGSKHKISEEEWVTVEVTNPADSINSKRNLGVLLLALEEASDVSNKVFAIEDMASERKLNKGTLVLQNNETENPIDMLLFNEYIIEYFANYLSMDNEESLEYQVEYILAGKNNDMDNLKNIATKILGIREAANFLYLYNNLAKRAQVAALAATVSAVLFVPALQPLLEYSMLFGWAFGESVQDLQVLFQGGRVPLIKTNASWCTDLSGVLSGDWGNPQHTDEGLSYQDYLRIFLALTPVDIKTMRSLDVIELTIRCTKGNEKFRIDGCIDGMEVEANIIGDFGTAFILNRKYSYWE